MVKGWGAFVRNTCTHTHTRTRRLPLFILIYWSVIYFIFWFICYQITQWISNDIFYQPREIRLLHRLSQSLERVVSRSFNNGLTGEECHLHFSFLVEMTSWDMFHWPTIRKRHMTKASNNNVFISISLLTTTEMRLCVWTQTWQPYLRQK